MAMQDFTFGQGDSKYASRKKKLRLKEKEAVRVSIVYTYSEAEAKSKGKPKIAGQPKFVGGEVHFFEGIGYVIDDGTGRMKKLHKENKDPAIRITTIVVKWPLKSSNTEDYEVMYWNLSKKKYEDVKNIHDEWDLVKTDLNIKCDGEKFQLLTIQPTKGSVMENCKKQSPETYARIMEEVAEYARTLQEEMGQDLSYEDLKERLSEASSTPSKEDDNLLSMSPSAAASSEDIENLISSDLDNL